MLPDIFKVAAALFCLLATVMLLRRQWADMEPAARSKSQQIFFRSSVTQTVGSLRLSAKRRLVPPVPPLGYLAPRFAARRNLIVAAAYGGDERTND